MDLQDIWFDATYTWPRNIPKKYRKLVKKVKAEAPDKLEAAGEDLASSVTKVGKKTRVGFSKLAKDQLKKPFQEWKSQRKAEKSYVKGLARERKKMLAEHEHRLKLREERRKLSEKYKRKARQESGLPVVRLFEGKK